MVILLFLTLKKILIRYCLMSLTIEELKNLVDLVFEVVASIIDLSAALQGP